MVDLVLLPGMDGTGLLFEPLRRQLAANIRVHTIDFPTRVPLGYADLLPLLRSRLPRDRPFVILGESFSGPLALMSAAEHPAGLCGVILCGSFVKSPVPWFPSALGRFVLADAFRLAPPGMLARLLLGPFETSEARRAIELALADVSADVMARRAREVLGVDVSAALRVCRAPILYLRAEQDWLVAARSWREIARDKPSARCVTLPGPHLLLHTLPEQSARAIEAFVHASARADTSPSGWRRLSLCPRYTTWASTRTARIMRH